MNSSVDEIRKEWNEARKQLFATGVFAVGLLAVGAVFFHYSKGLSWVDAFYYCTITLTTVGYGDIVPQTDGQKIFIIFYILAGIGIIASFASLLIKNGSLRREYKRAKRQAHR